ncbi:MAG: hypothetical protein ACFFBX_00735, partial [Promethearchaeota archaeon]
ITNFPSKLRKKMKAKRIIELTQLFYSDNKLIDAVTLAEFTEASIREALEARQFGRKHIESILVDITGKRKVEPHRLLWKNHWLLGVVAQGNYRDELIALEASAIATILENLENVTTETLEQILMILLHRLLLIPDSTLKAEYEQLIEFAEKYQRSSLFAYNIAKAKAILDAVGVEVDPTKLIIQLRKLSNNWKALMQVMEQRGKEKGKMVLVALHAIDSLKVLDVSEKHLKTQVEKTMSTQKLRKSQLTHITAAMNAAIELRDAYLVAKLASRASKIWFELAQGKAGKDFADDLLRSLRFARTAIFHYRALDDLSRAVKQLEHIIHLIGEIPFKPPEIFEEAVIGVLKTFVNTVPILDRPADQKFILQATTRLDRIISRLNQQLTTQEARYNLAKLQVNFAKAAISQLQQLGTEPEKFSGLNRELIQALLQLAKTAPDEEKDELLNSAATHASHILINIKPTSRISEQDLEIVSKVTSQLAKNPPDTLSKVATQLIKQSHQLNEQLYFQTKDPQIRAKLALQLLLSKITPDSSGKIALELSLKELDKLEEYASTALLTQVKEKQPIPVLKAGSLLVWIILQRLHHIQDQQQTQKLKEDARDFTEKTFTFMPSSTELPIDVFPFAWLLLRNINMLVHEEEPTDEPKWEQLLTHSEQLAQTLAKAAKTRDDISNEILALSAAGTATAKLATITTSSDQRLRLLRRATTQIQKALQAATSQGNPKDIEIALLQYDQLMQARLTLAPIIFTQRPILDEWNQTYIEAVKALQSSNAPEIANRLEAYRILNVQVPLTFTFIITKKETQDSVRRQLTELLQEVSKIGSSEQRQLAKQLERRWAFQLGEDSLLASGYRLEDAETIFTLADEHFRISLQIEPQITVNNQTLQKIRSYPYLRPASQPNELVWYDATPILCSVYADNELFTWSTLQEPSENSVTVGFWLITSKEIKAVLTLQILAIEGLSQSPDGVKIQLPGAQVQIPMPPAIAEHREAKGVLVYELTLTPEFPKALPIHVQIAESP